MRTVASSALVRQLVKLAMVGGVGFVVDVTVFTALRVTVLAPERLHEGAIIANWVGNRYWTFGPHRSTRSGAEALEFLAVSLLGLLVAVGCLWVSHYLLGFTSPLADNLSSNVVGLLLGSVLRFALYRHWVYSPTRRNRIAVRAASGRVATPE